MSKGSRVYLDKCMPSKVIMNCFFPSLDVIDCTMKNDVQTSIDYYKELHSKKKNPSELEYSNLDIMRYVAVCYSILILIL